MIQVTYTDNLTGSRWGELVSPASRSDPVLIRAAGEARAAIAEAVCTPTGWATPDQIASRLDLAHSLTTLQLGMVAAVDVAYLTRDVAATHPHLTAPARAIGMRAQSEAEHALDRGDSHYTGMSWATPRQIWTNQVIPLPAPARHGLVNLSDQVITASIQVEAAATPLRPSGPEPRPKADPGRLSPGASNPRVPARAPDPEGPRR